MEFEPRAQNPESQETDPNTRPIKLTIEPPDGTGHTWNIQFESESPEHIATYNAAIHRVTEAAGLMPFHQGGQGNEPGWHMWEFFRLTKNDDLDTTRGQLESIIDTIHNQANSSPNPEHSDLTEPTAPDTDIWGYDEDESD